MRILGGNDIHRAPFALEDRRDQGWNRRGRLGLQAGQLGGLVALRNFAPWIEAPSRRYTTPTPVVTKGHVLDTDTIGLWRFDEQFVENRGTALPQDEQGVTYAMVNASATATPLGFTSFRPAGTDTPLGQMFARKWTCAEDNSTGGDNIRLTRATSGAMQTMFIGSWTFDAFVRLDSLPNANSYYLLGHQGDGTNETAAHNALINLAVGTTGSLQAVWEFGAGSNEIVNLTNSILTVGQWCYLCVVKDAVANTVTVYINGVQTDSVSYANEPTSGTSGTLVIGGNNAQGPASGQYGVDAAFRAVSMSTAVKGAEWVAENYRRFFTTGTITKDATSFLTLNLTDQPAAYDYSPYGHDMQGADGAGASNITVPVGSLIPEDTGAGRAFATCTLATWFSKVIRDAMLADFTFEAWVQIMAPVASTGNGIWHHSGDPNLETQVHNRCGGNILANGTLMMHSEVGAGAEGSPSPLTSDAGAIEIGKRYHLAFRKTMTGPTYTAAIFANGVKVAELANIANYDGGSRADSVHFYLGGGTGIASDQAVFFGFMDDARLSKVARTDDEIMESYRTGDNLAPGLLVNLIDPSPALGIIPGTRAQARYTVLSFTCENGATTPFCLWAKFANDDQPVLVYDSTTGFAPLFNHPRSTWDLGSERMTLMQLGGWQDDIESICVGGQGNVDSVPVRAGGGDDPPDDLSREAFGWQLPER